MFLDDTVAVPATPRLRYRRSAVQHLIAFFSTAQALLIIHEVAHLIIRSRRRVADGRVLGGHQRVGGGVERRERRRAAGRGLLAAAPARRPRPEAYTSKQQPETQHDASRDEHGDVARGRRLRARRRRLRVLHAARYHQRQANDKEGASEQAEAEPHTDGPVEAAGHSAREVADGAVPPRVLGLLLVGHRGGLVHCTRRHRDEIRTTKLHSTTKTMACHSNASIYNLKYNTARSFAKILTAAFDDETTFNCFY